MLNGALTLRTLDGANVEIDEVELDVKTSIFFGKESDEIINFMKPAVMYLKITTKSWCKSS